ncbi:pilus assembly protein TadG-related protein [Mesorhizobium sp. MSK_1335]|uniref:Pilus assembly protein TadG-related protein n=1 Tax=Mesorhizobium montanum TaxID=3072323 RepID=A0ABU4ZRH4_9HYPH|nr:pilus assembly protein TadG-related protein [Mesorhizobium sp. MSK_1335]MDX8526633.1 pilus assembly protein TadG-related protein [Mesorhizobium sp. MSK_1335]
MLRTIREFWDDQRGIAMILVAIMLPVIVGFALLAIDMSRANNLHNDLQKATDAFALAGAAELDGSTGSWARAERAMATLVHNESNFSTSGRFTLAAGQPGGTANCNSAGNISWCFLKAIPAADSTQITAANLATYLADADPAIGQLETQFIQVTVAPNGFDAIFPASFISGNAADNSFTVGAVAVAGFVSGVCDFTPVFICNPYEMDANGTNTAGGYTLKQAVSDPAVRRRLIELRKVGNGAAAGPGNFGFLEPPAGVGNGAQALAETIATSKPIGCYESGHVSTKTGQNAGPVQDAFNVRFGIRATGGGFNSAVYGPASNVRKGAVPSSKGNQCPQFNQLTFNGPGNMGLPRDATTPYMNGRMGDGNWNLSGYWSTNFSSASHPSSWDTTKPSRYDVYKYEIAQGLVGTASTGGEVGTPANACQPPVTSVDRRLLYGAILNCNALEAAGNDLSGHSTNLPVEAFGSFFLTEPVPSASDDASVMVELVDVTGANGQGTLNSFVRDEAQLYR